MARRDPRTHTPLAADMSHPDPFLSAILASPNDDAPRLLYADWLEEQGEGERSEFIRVQVALAKHEPGSAADHWGDNIYGLHRGTAPLTGECKECVGIQALRRRERELLDAAPKPCLFSGFPVAFTSAGGLWRSGRGFPEFIVCTAAAWLAHADALTAAAPIREVRLTTWPGAQSNESTGPVELDDAFLAGFRVRRPPLVFVEHSGFGQRRELAGVVQIRRVGPRRGHAGTLPGLPVRASRLKKKKPPVVPGATLTSSQP